MPESRDKNPAAADPAPAAEADDAAPAADSGKQPVEVGGRDGLDPTRYGDWEKAGRCIDF